MLLRDIEKGKKKVECSPVSLKELALCMVNYNYDDTYINIRRSTGEVFNCLYEEIEDEKAQLEEQPLWYRLQIDDDILQIDQNIVGDSKGTIDEFAISHAPDRKDTAEYVLDQKVVNEVLGAIWFTNRNWKEDTLNAFEKYDLWTKYLDYAASCYYRYAKELLDSYGFPYIDDRPPLEEWLKEARESEGYNLPRTAIEEFEVPDYPKRDFDDDFWF